MAVLLTRVGLLLDFLAFFLAAPEILGEDRIRGMQRYLRSGLIVASFGLFVFAIIGTTALLLFWVVIPVVTIASSAAKFFSAAGAGFSPDSLILPYMVFGVGSAGLSWIPMRLMKIVERLSTNGQFRRQLLNLGVLLFVFGTLAQIVGTF